MAHPAQMSSPNNSTTTQPTSVRKIPLDDARDRTFQFMSFLLVLLKTLALSFICVVIGHSLGDFFSSTRVPASFPWIPLFCWTVIAAGAEGLRLNLEHISARLSQWRYQDRLLAHVFRRGPAQLAKERRGALISLLSQGTTRIAEYRQTYLGHAIGGIFSPVVVLIVMACYADPVTAAWLCVTVPVLPLLLGSFSHVTRKVSTRSRQARARLSARYLDALRGLENLTITGAAPRVSQELAELGEANRREIMRVLAANQLILFIIDAGFYLAFISTSTALALWRVGRGELDVGDGLAICLLSILLLAPMSEIGGFFYVGMAGRAQQRAFRGFLGTSIPPGTTSSSPYPDQVMRHGSSHCVGEKDAPELQITDLRFRYPSASLPVLDQVNITFERGKFYGIAGRSGSGKTTLLRLLSGVLTPEHGTLKINGHPCGCVDLREASAVVNQFTWLFSGTIRENLLLAHPAATEEEMWVALKKARLDHEVQLFPQGLDTRIGEGGAGLSGGQAQRLSLARALLSGRRLLILDEPTAHIDRVSECYLLEGLRNLGSDYTIIMSTHRENSFHYVDSLIDISELGVKK
ncbi:ATP-binding cassette domain-containing protein [Corynebacterium sp. 3HC-13]|uniref:ATP-binding cassette domain-containing protein n=1 Tax=Corynebacterium poyangense TaxID=2684405 RepID=UPI001CC9C39C|nr:ATP-binding cassette domain-containing protein [Corynebacterium poyangense]MBZ8178059.1 ATP-binding cassette domain-containing protein [Corynebacterium poyangense]